MKRGEVWWAELEPRSGSEQRGRRPALIVSHEVFNRDPDWRSLIVVPLSTSQAQARRGPTAVPVSQAAHGLAPGSVALCHQVTTLDRSKLTRLIGAVHADVMKSVEAGLKLAMNLP